MGAVSKAVVREARGIGAPLPALLSPIAKGARRRVMTFRHVDPLLVAAVILFALTAGVPGRASDDHMFCINQDLRGDVRYYSAVFLEDYSDARSIGSDFHDHLEQEGRDPSYTDTWCFFENSYSAANREFERHVRDDEDTFRVVLTNWAPESFTAQPLQDFHITVAERRQEVEVCVRDHECEDGDRVRVSVNGGLVFSGEIDNGWVCDRVDVSAGRNRVELYAVNGSGRKGNCSYADVNTGELRVEGKNMVTQSWRHRGGAGSSAAIIVEVD